MSDGSCCPDELTVEWDECIERACATQPALTSRAMDVRRVMRWPRSLSQPGAAFFFYTHTATWSRNTFGVDGLVLRRERARPSWLARSSAGDLYG